MIIILKVSTLNEYVNSMVSYMEMIVQIVVILIITTQLILVIPSTIQNL